MKSLRHSPSSVYMTWVKRLGQWTCHPKQVVRVCIVTVVVGVCECAGVAGFLLCCDSPDLWLCWGSWFCLCYNIRGPWCLPVLGDWWIQCHYNYWDWEWKMLMWRNAKCHWILARWHCMQDRVHLHMSVLIPGYTNLVLMSRWVALIPRCYSLCRELNSVRHHWSGMRGHWVPVETSQRMVSLELSVAMGFTTKGETGEDSRARIWRSICCL